MKTLPTQFQAGGFLHTQLDLESPFAIYRRERGGSEHYEVIEINWVDAYTIKGIDIEEGERYPDTSTWGKKGWTFQTYQSAREKFTELRNGKK